MSNTYTLNFSYGLGLVAAGTGVLLNNELDDFAAKPDAPNAYGLVGFRGQRARPGQAAAVVDDADDRVEGRQAVPGHRLAGRQPHHHRGAASHHQRDRPRIDIAEAVSAPRMHNQWLPDQVFVEPGFADDLVAALQARGDKVVLRSAARRPIRSWSHPAGFVGAADPRTRGALAVGF